MRLLALRPVTYVLRNGHRSFSSGSPRDRFIQPIRWGILSAGKISSDFTNAVCITDNAVAHAVAARNGDKAADFAQRHNIPKSYGSYEELLKDPEIDVVYVGCIADEHFRVASLALKHKKPTVVEKPLTLSLQETTQLVKLAKQQDTFLQEAMWTRFFPAMQKVRELIQQGQIGKVVCIQGDFGWSSDHCGPDHRIWYPESGGMTLDIGMYLAQLGQVAFNSDPTDIQSMALHKNGVDHTTMVNIQYDDEGFLQFYVTGEANTEERVLIQGTSGRIIIDPPAHVPSRIRLLKDRGRGSSEETVMNYPFPDDTKQGLWNFPGSIGLTYQAASIGEALRAGKKECDHFTHADSIQIASTIDTILEQVHHQRDSDMVDDEPQSM